MVPLPLSVVGGTELRRAPDSNQLLKGGPLRYWFTLPILQPIRRTLSEHGIARVLSGLRFHQDGASPFLDFPPIGAA